MNIYLYELLNLVKPKVWYPVGSSKKNRIISIFKNESEIKKVSRNAKKNLGVSWSEIIKKYYKIYNEEISIKKDC